MESALCSIYALVVFVSEIERVSRRNEGVRFLLQKQVPKYLTPALSMKYSLFITLKMFTSIVTVLNPLMFSEQTQVSIVTLLETLELAPIERKVAFE